jgi:hypothetical protein
MYARDKLQPRIKATLSRSSDLSHYTLNSVIDLMLAQAQECYYKKAEYGLCLSEVCYWVHLELICCL